MMQPIVGLRMANNRTEITYPFAHTTFCTRSAPPGHSLSDAVYLVYLHHSIVASYAYGQPRPIARGHGSNSLTLLRPIHSHNVCRRTTRPTYMYGSIFSSNSFECSVNIEAVWFHFHFRGNIFSHTHIAAVADVVKEWNRSDCANHSSSARVKVALARYANGLPC